MLSCLCNQSTLMGITSRMFKLEMKDLEFPYTQMRIWRLIVFVFSMNFFVFLLVMNLYLLILSSAANFAGNETDHLALLAFKAKITYDLQDALRSWNDSIHFCNWEGVTCGQKHRRVTILDFQSRGLVGSLSPYIANMSFLRELRLQNNSLHGEISPELGRLFRLQFLHLGNNSFEGEIPSNLSRCSNVQILRVSYNKLVGHIPWELGTLSKLRRFSIQDNYLSGSIPPSIGNLTSLEALSARENFLSGTIPESLKQLKFLSMLSVATNKLSGIFPPAIYNISSINVISVSENQLHGSLPSDIGFLLPHLQHFQIWGNHFSGSIPVSLSNASELEYIDIQRNNFTGKVAVDFGALKGLNFLSLYGNSLGSKEGDDLKFMASLLNCSKLAMLDISLNQLEGVLPNSVANLSSSLQRLSIGKNRIYGSIPPWFSTLDSLLVMGIEDTQITSTIPMELGRLQSLQQMFLGHNRLSGEIPSSLGNLSSLTLLHLQDNELQGTIPSSLGNCKNLLFIDLSQNKLNGSISNQLFSATNMLVSIDFSQNHLVGSLTSDIGNLFHLNELVIFHNNLSGSIPYDLGKCTSLEYLVMDDNKFQGTIPTSFESLKGLRRLDLSMNILSGKIPGDFVNFKLEYLNLSYNNLEGEVPSNGVFANASVISVEGNNRLCGGIPELKLPRCIITKRSKSDLVKKVVIVISCVSVGTIMSAFLCYWFRHEKKEGSPSSFQQNSLEQFSYGRIYKATNRLSSENLIGVGSFGSVYKGILDEDEAIVAIKVLNLQQPGASKSFMAECETLKNIRHRNLLKIISSCSSVDFQGNEFKALIYEYMPNGNLEKWLHLTSNIDTMRTDDRCSLSLVQRIDILIDVGNALDYLHFQCQEPIIHCDLKPSNILLDKDMVAHVGDFGLAKFLHQPSHSSSVGVKGTIGYTAPEYGLGSEMSTSGDVYSFGIILLEMMTRKKPTNVSFGEDHNLHNFCKMACPDQVLEIVDPVLLRGDEVRESNEQGSMQTGIDDKNECLISMIKIGISCSMEAPQDRMDIRDALNNLHSIRKNYIGTTKY